MSDPAPVMRPSAELDGRDPDGIVPGADPADLVALLTTLGSYRRLLVGLPLAVAVVAAVVSLLLPLTYTAAATILPPQQGQSTAAAMLGQLGGLAGAAASSALGVKSPGDLYIGMLKSNTVADAMIARFDLRRRYDVGGQEAARKRLARASRFGSDVKSGLIRIEVDARDAQLAADMGNAYVEELHKITSTLAISEAAQRRVFFERQLQQTKEKLVEAEVNLRRAIEAGGLVSVDVQGRATLETIARLRAQISAKEIQLSAMRAYATDTNPDLRRGEQELESMRRELGRLETGDALQARRGSAASRSDGAGVENIRLLREVKYNEALFEMLMKQYELARVDESKEAPIVQVLDRAMPPELRSAPKRGQIVVVATLGGAVFAVLLAFGLNALRAAQRDPAQRRKLDGLRSAWLGRPAA